jgi:FkbM family methyltransferase
MSNETKGSPIDRFGAHVRDWFIARFPVRMHTRTGNIVSLWDRTQLRLYEQMFVEQVFPLRQSRDAISTASPVILDVGCNSGLFSLSALDVWPEAQIHAFEPQGELIRRFTRVIDENELRPNIHLNHVAVSGECAQATIFKNRASISASIVEAKAQRRTIIGSESVQTTTLDHYVEEEKLQVDILKLDVEGAELDALRGAERVLQTAKVFFIEVHPPFAEPAQIEDICAKHGLTRRKEWERPGKKCNDLVFVRA